MGVVLGLSLTSDEVVWVLVDECARMLLDHDARAVLPTAADVVAAARSGRSLAAVDGVELGAVRITGIGGVTDEVLTRLHSAGFENVEVIDLADAVATAAAYPPEVRAAVGAALGPRDGTPAPAMAAPTRRRGGVLATVIGTAAAAVLGMLFLATGSVPQDAQAAAVEPAAATESGWVSVPVTPLHTPTVTRKVVTATTQTRTVPAAGSAATERVHIVVRPAETRPVESPAPQPAAHAPTPQPAAEQQHLSDAAALMAGPAPAAPAPVEQHLPTSDVVMTDLSNMFTALP